MVVVSRWLLFRERAEGGGGGALTVSTTVVSRIRLSRLPVRRWCLAGTVTSSSISGRTFIMHIPSYSLTFSSFADGWEMRCGGE